MGITQFYMLLGGALFSLGAFGVLLRKNAIVILMCVELMLNGVNLTLVALSRQFSDTGAQVAVFFVMAVAAAEAAVGLAIVLAVFRNFRSVQVADIHDLQG